MPTIAAAASTRGDDDRGVFLTTLALAELKERLPDLEDHLVGRSAGASLLDEVEGLMRRALEARSRALVLADRATRLYGTLVHAAAVGTFVGWLAAGVGWHAALLDAAPSSTTGSKRRSI